MGTGQTRKKFSKWHLRIWNGGFNNMIQQLIKNKSVVVSRGASGWRYWAAPRKEV